VAPASPAAPVEAEAAVTARTTAAQPVAAETAPTTEFVGPVSAAPQQPALTWPVSGTAGVDSSRPFNWSRVPWATNYWLTIGTTEGGSDILNTGPLPAGQTSFAALPPFPPGVPLHARLLTSDGKDWTYADIIFTAAGR
ncbi:MAG TPA: hypothetical protein VHT75_00735, partial [Acidimicrobiales bacterium]|nr:hypothetical protein [Acidimicrobiales bacterium]